MFLFFIFLLYLLYSFQFFLFFFPSLYFIYLINTSQLLFFHFSSLSTMVFSTISSFSIRFSILSACFFIFASKLVSFPVSLRQFSVCFSSSCCFSPHVCAFIFQSFCCSRLNDFEFIFIFSICFFTFTVNLASSGFLTIFNTYSSFIAPFLLSTVIFSTTSNSSIFLYVFFIIPFHYFICKHLPTFIFPFQSVFYYRLLNNFQFFDSSCIFSSSHLASLYWVLTFFLLVFFSHNVRSIFHASSYCNVSHLPAFIFQFQSFSCSLFNDF